MIRWLGADDLAAWRDIRAEGLRLSPTAFLTTLEEFMAECDASVAAQLSKGQVLAVFEDDTVMAVAAFRQLTAKAQTHHRAEISAIYARPAARGAGAAHSLMQHIEAHARDLGVTQLELYVEASNAAAQRFYEKLGYAQFGSLPNAAMVDGVANDDFFMVRLLGR